MSMYFKTSETKTSIHPDKISGKDISKLINKAWKVRFDFYVNPARILLICFWTTGPYRKKVRELIKLITFKSVNQFVFNSSDLRKSKIKHIGAPLVMISCTYLELNDELNEWIEYFFERWIERVNWALTMNWTNLYKWIGECCDFIFICIRT